MRERHGVGAGGGFEAEGTAEREDSSCGGGLGGMRIRYLPPSSQAPVSGSWASPFYRRTDPGSERPRCSSKAAQQPRKSQADPQSLLPQQPREQTSTQPVRLFAEHLLCAQTCCISRASPACPPPPPAPPTPTSPCTDGPEVRKGQVWDARPGLGIRVTAGPRARPFPFQTSVSPSVNSRRGVSLSGSARDPVTCFPEADGELGVRRRQEDRGRVPGLPSPPTASRRPLLPAGK